MTKNPEWKSVLRPLAMTFARRIGRMSDEQLRQLVIARGAVTETNCWWVEYRLAGIAGDIAESERRLREKRAAQAGEAGTAATTEGPPLPRRHHDHPII